MRIPRRWTALLLLLGIGLLGSIPAGAEREGRGGIIRELLDGLTSGSPEEIGDRARATRDAAEAERLYRILATKHRESDPGVRAALWLGRFHYGVGRESEALAFFEQARKSATDPSLIAEATFWCEQVRLLTGREPLAADRAGTGERFWTLLRRLALVDRAIAGGRRAEAEEDLLSLEGRAREAGLLGPLLARWSRLLRLPGPGRVDRNDLEPLVRATVHLPEHLGIETTQPRCEPGPPAWSIQFGAYLNHENAVERREELQRIGLDARVDGAGRQGQAWYWVRWGDVTSRAAADSLASSLAGTEVPPYEIVRIR